LAAASVVAFALLSPQWNHARLASGAYRIASVLAAGDIETALQAGEFSFYREGAAGTVSVRHLIGVTSLAIDGKVDASNGADMLTQKLLAHLPLLLHENPQSVYIIGLGSGVTLGAALRHPITSAVVSEISPEVVAASAAFAKRLIRTTQRFLTPAKMHKHKAAGPPPFRKAPIGRDRLP